MLTMITTIAMIAIISVTAMISDVMLSQCCFELQRSFEKIDKNNLLSSLQAIKIFEELLSLKKKYHYIYLPLNLCEQYFLSYFYPAVFHF